MSPNISPDELLERIAVDPEQLDELEYWDFGTVNSLKDTEETYGTGFIKAVNHCLGPHGCSDPARDYLLYELVVHYLTVEKKEVTEYMRRQKLEECERNNARLTIALQDTCACRSIENRDELRKRAYRDRYLAENERKAFITDLEMLREGDSGEGLSA
jgi:hypothetical protein